MATSLERIVRPFETGDVFTRSRLTPISQTPVTVSPPDQPTTWEGAADTDYTTFDNIWYKTWDSDLKEDKTQRISKTVKVVNPDDEDQKVFVERIDKAVFKDDSGKTMSLKFDWSNPKDGGV